MSAAASRHGHDRRRRGRGAEGHRARRGRAAGRDRDPRLLLRAAARAARRRLPHVPRARSSRAAEAAGRLHADRAGRAWSCKTAPTSQMAAEAQNATLEFILVNHPLDCPVCDKGGECPLQDLTFRYGPGNTRMTFPKRTFEKPIPISPTDRARPRALHPLLPLHALLEGGGRGRPARRVDRGAQSMIATFEDEPYRAPFSGNVIELCPVGALTSTQYRFEARPWEIQNVPTVCGLCPVGCNINATTREGKVKRILSRNHPEVDDGWLCDKGRFAFPHLHAERPDPRPAPARTPRAASRSSPGTTRSTRPSDCCATRAGASSLRSPAPRRSSRPTRSAKLLRRGLGAHAAVLARGDLATRSTPSARRSRRSATPSSSSSLGDEPVVERAPVVDLWIKAARRNGAEVARRPDRARRDRRSAAGRAGDPDLVRHGDLVGRRRRGRRSRHCAQRLGASRRAFHLPATPNGRGVADAWAAAGRRRSEATRSRSAC